MLGQYTPVQVLELLNAKLAGDKQLGEIKPKLHPPTEFTGGGGLSASQWLASTESYLALTTSRTDAARIAVTSTFLRGPAQGWWQQQEASLRNGPWDQFKTAFLAYFQPVNASATARTKLLNLRQRGGPNGFSDYRDRFNRYLTDVEPPMGEPEKISLFTNGLLPETKKHILLHEPETCNKAMQLAGRVEEAGRHAWRTERDDRQPRRWNRPTHNHNPPGFTTPSGDPSGPAPMELGKHEFEPERRHPKSYPSQQQQRRCDFCGSTGHLIRECTRMKQARKAFQQQVPRGGSAEQTQTRN